ncbi:MAG: M3 family oligoendopeptidase [Solobacterium sp.]|nr:M3 family oligoendopeptidase [Solobacterium sp.]
MAEIRFEEIIYQRPNLTKIKEEMAVLTERLRTAATYEAAREVFRQIDQIQRHVATMAHVADVRQNINTNDSFYDSEKKWLDDASVEFEEATHKAKQVLLKSPFRKEFEAEYGELMFLNAEIAAKSFAPVIMKAMQEEIKTANAYEDLLASARVPFRGKEYTLPEMERFKTDLDDETRLAAWIADGQWYKDNQQMLDDSFDTLVRLRDGMARTMGYPDYVELGYYRMGRNCYDRHDVEKFRQAVVEYVVPLAQRIYFEQAKRNNKPFPLTFSDAAVEFMTGNARPVGGLKEIVEAARKFYDAQSPETSAFFNSMIERGMMDLESKEGKRGGGYCIDIPDYNTPFIFANFNGTQHDVEVLTHEAGHGFEAWLNMERIPYEYVWPTMEAAEVHSMSMEVFAEKAAEAFFGKDANKYLFSHLAGAITFIPYGTMVDHFQHIVYEKPGLTRKQRHEEWKRLERMYRPWLKLDGAIPFWSEGESWQFKHHIYSSPFYYIDYCLAQTVALEFWAMIQDDEQDAWQHYMAFTKMGGTKTFTDLLAASGMSSPFDPETLHRVCAKADAYLDAFDLRGIK